MGFSRSVSLEEVCGVWISRLPMVSGVVEGKG
jgi:hypothetical protein